MTCKEMCMPQAETPQPTSVKQYLKLQFNLQLDAQTHKTIMLVNPLLRKALCPTSLFLFIWKETYRQENMWELQTETSWPTSVHHV